MDEKLEEKDIIQPDEMHQETETEDEEEAAFRSKYGLDLNVENENEIEDTLEESSEEEQPTDDQMNAIINYLEGNVNEDEEHEQSTSPSHEEDNQDESLGNPLRL